MKAAKRSILICVLTLILSVSLLAGVTFAWFTDSITNSGNTIQSGELAIDATAYDRVDTEAGGLTVTIGEGNVASGTYYFEAEGTSLRNGDPVITEENWQPGDMNAKLFTVSNEGSIDAVVSLDFFVSGDLAQYLWYDFIAVNPADGSLLGEFLQRNDLNTISDLADSYGEVTLKPEEQVTFLFVYGLPTSATNEAMNKAVNVNVVVSAKQNVEGAEGPVVVNPGTDLSETTIDSGDTILLSEGDYEVSQPVTVEGKQNIVIDGNGATIKASSAEGASIMSATSKRIAVAADTQTDLANNIINVSGATNVTIRNLTIVGALHHGINIWECENVVIENVTIINSDATAITINGSDVTLNSVTTSGSGWGGVNVDLGNSGSSEITVDENCAFGEFLPLYADSEDIANAVTVNVPENYNKAIVDLTGIGEVGVERVVWSSTIVETAAELNSAVVNGGYVILANDITSTSSFSVNTDTVLYLNDKTWNIEVNGEGSFYGTNGATFTVSYGDVEIPKMTNRNDAASIFSAGEESGLVLQNLDVNSYYAVAALGSDNEPKASPNSKITVDGCNILCANSAAITTNASSNSSSLDGGFFCEIEIKNSTIECDNSNGDPYLNDNCPIYINVRGHLKIDNSTIKGQRQSVMVRCGTAEISNTTIITTGAGNYKDMYLNGNWGSGNEVPMAALVIGNRGGNYNYAATVTLTNCTIKSENTEVPAIYIWGNTEEGAGAKLTVDSETVIVGNIAGNLNAADGSVVIEGIKFVANKEELFAAVTVGGYVVLANDITIVPAGIGDAIIPQMNINENTTLYLNGKTLSFDKTATTESLSYTPAFFGVMSGATLTIYGDGVIDAEANYNNSFGINVNGGNLVINGGTYYGAMSAVQVQKGNCTINGGHFELADTIKEAAPQYSTYLINCIDANFSNGTAVVYVKGGTFVNFNPSASQGEPNAPVSFVDSENYTVESAVQENGETWYTVVPKA